MGAHYENASGTDSGSAYIYTWDADNSQFIETKIAASDGADYYYFGVSVDIAADGRIVVVGAWYDDDYGTNSGAAYIYDFNGISWPETQKITASDGAANDYFGHSVTISADGKNIVVGAAYNDGTAGTNSGAAYLFQYDGVIWQEVKILHASDLAADDLFGFSVSVTEDGKRVVIGSVYDDDNGSNSGAVYTYQINNVASLNEFSVDEVHQPTNITSFSPEVFVSDTVRFNGGSLLLTNTAVAGDNFTIENQGTGSGQISVSGSDISYEGNVIGTIDGTANGLDGNNLLINFTTGDASAESLTALIHAIQYQNTSADPEAVRNISMAIFDEEGASTATISQTINVVAVANIDPIIAEIAEVKTIASDGQVNDYYGDHIAVSADGSTLVVGSAFVDDNGSDAGAIYVYAWDGSNWVNEEKLIPIDGAAGDHFGFVSISDNGNTILVGADWDDDNDSNGHSTLSKINWTF